MTKKLSRKEKVLLKIMFIVYMYEEPMFDYKEIANMLDEKQYIIETYYQIGRSINSSIEN